jgi:hypothetical protein
MKLDTELSLTQGTYWECLNCGAKYVTVTSICNLQVKAKPTSTMINLSSTVCTLLVKAMQEMLYDIYYSGLPSEEDSNGTKDHPFDPSCVCQQCGEEIARARRAESGGTKEGNVPD